jgi:hypothetical protein
MCEMMGLIWRHHRADHVWHGMDDRGNYTARVDEHGGRWRAYLNTTNEQLAGDHATATAAMVAVDEHLARRRPRPVPADIHQDIRTLRGINQVAPCRYQEILHAGLGPGAAVSRAVRRLTKAGYVSGDDRWITITDAGSAALRRLDDPAAKQRLLADLFYGDHSTLVEEQ